MSGGHFNYYNDRLKEEIFDWSHKPFNALEDRELSELTWDLLDLLHIFDLYKSGDTGKERYLEHKATFKKKWFSNRGLRIKSTIDKAIADLKIELYETYMLKVNDDE